MSFIWDVYKGSAANWIIALVLINVIGALLIVCITRFIKRRIPLIALCITYGLFILSFIFYLPYIGILSCGCFIVCLLITLIVNLGDFRKFISNPFRSFSGKNQQHKVEKIIDRNSLYTIIEKTVLSLSNTKTGAIITFEKNQSLRDIMQNGVFIHAPVSQELLETIFYPGTRLHDGAVIIHGNEIVAASVFFTPTTKAFAGKYGSRHRAAIGVSEIADSVTVVVSEETGRISFAVNGQLESVNRDDFKRALENYLS